jgi:hypothetical protein
LDFSVQEKNFWISKKLSEEVVSVSLGDAPKNATADARHKLPAAPVVADSGSKFFSCLGIGNLAE